jgi:hypothetical protein
MLACPLSSLVKETLEGSTYSLFGSWHSGPYEILEVTSHGGGSSLPLLPSYGVSVLILSRCSALNLDCERDWKLALDILQALLV